MRRAGCLALAASAALLTGATDLAPATATAPALTPALSGAGEVRVAITGLRGGRGQVLACLTARPRAFPDCTKDPAARKLAVSARGDVAFDFAGLAPGRYAIAVIHDENGNGKMDMMLFMPREGFGFSRDAPVRMGPPSFASAAFAVAGEAQRQTIRIRYMI